MESVEEDVEDERQTEGSPANSQRCKKLIGWDDQSFGVSSTRSQYDIDSEAYNEIINARYILYIDFILPDLKDDYYHVVNYLLHKL